MDENSVVNPYSFKIFIHAIMSTADLVTDSSTSPLDSASPVADINAQPVQKDICLNLSNSHIVQYWIHWPVAKVVNELISFEQCPPSLRFPVLRGKLVFVPFLGDIKTIQSAQSCRKKYLLA